MQVCVDKKCYKQDTFRTLAPLNWLLNLIGLGCNLTGEKKPRTFWAIAKTVVTVSALGVVDFYTLHYKLNYLSFEMSPSIKYTDIIQVFYDFTQYLVDLFFIRKFGNAMSYGYFKQYEIIDQIIGIVSYTTSRKKVLKIMIFFVVLWMTSSICDFVAWVLSNGWLESLIFTTSYVFLFIKILTTLDLTSHVMHIDCRLIALGDKMQTYCDATESSSPLFERNKKKWLDISTRDVVDVPKSIMPRTSSVNYHEINWLSRCYLLLTEQATFINKMYGIRILLNSLSLLIDMVRFTNIAARILMGSQKTKYISGYTYIPVVSSVVRMMTCATVLASLARHCELVYRQRERILDIIDNLLVYKKPGEDVKKAASELRDLIQTRPIDFTMANFFRIDFSLLVSITSVVVTYSIILLQNIN